MNAQWFDGLTRQLAMRQPRRTTIALAVGALATVLAGRNRDAQASCKKVGKTCDKNKDCCDGAQCKKDKCKCKCKNGFTKCGKKCYDLDKDEKHCGSCNIQCAEDDGEICDNGQCVNVPS